MSNYGNMSDLWNYLIEILENVPNEYKLGKFGQKTNGKCQYDCVCLIKSYPWCNGKAGAAPQYKANNIADDWLGNLYVYADKKSDNMSELPKEGIWLVYLNNEHIAVYNAATSTTIECCAGNTMKVVERDLHHYDGSKYQWNKWSNLYWCPQGETNTRSTIRKTNNTTPDTSTSVTDKYTVIKGDTMYGIAKKFHITLNNLLKLNPKITNPSVINAGQVIKVAETTENTQETPKNNIQRYSAELYVGCCYIEYLNRLPDTGELETYANYLLNGGERIDIDNALLNSDEYNTTHAFNDNFKRNYIIQCYDLLLGRFPESEDVIQNWMNDTNSLIEIYTGIYESEEAENYRNNK